jgi:GAF domain-containing protein
MTQDASRHYRALYAVARAVNSTLDEHDVMSIVARSISQAVEVKGCALRLLSDHETLDLVASHGLSDEYLGKGLLRPEAAGAATDALAGKPVIAHVGDTSQWQYPDEARREGIATSLTVPLTIKDRPIGILRLYAAERRDFSDEEIEFVAALADLAALAIQNAHLHHELQREKDILTEYTFGPFAPRR